jgi:AraC-like DNA-binding protein
MPKDENDFAPIRFSTDAFSERDRIPMWHDVFSRTMLQVHVESLTPDPFYTDATFRALPGFRTVSCETSAARYERSGELLRDCNDDVSLFINMEGSVSGSQNGRSVTLGPGDATVIPSQDSAVMTKSEGRWAGIIVPYAALAPLTTNLGDAAMQLVSGKSDALRLLKIYVNAVRDELSLASPEMSRVIATHVADLFALAIGATRDGSYVASARGGRAARLRAIKADIAANLSRPDLGVTAVALRQSITPRSVQLLFELEGTTFSEYLLGERLRLARRMLSDPKNATMRISTIAFAAGFGDLSYFNRTFRARYGLVPSDIRKIRP